MRIQHNIMALNAYRNYNTNVSAMKSNLEKLSSGYKINRAGDDAAGLAISEKMRAQITGLNAAQKNVKDGISLVQTAEGAMQEVQDMLNRMVYLATQSANGTYDNEVDRANLQKELDQLTDEIDRISDSANFNGIKLLDGSKAAPITQGTTTTTISMGTMTELADASLPAAGTVIGSDTVVNLQGKEAVKTKFEIDFSQVEWKAAASNSTVQVSIGGKDITLTATTANQTIDDLLKATYSAGITMTLTTAADADSFKLTYADGKLTVEMENAPDADTIDADLDPSMTVTVSDATKQWNAGTTNMVRGEKPAASTPANTLITAANLGIQGTGKDDGFALEIDGKNFVIAVGDDSDFAGGAEGATVVKVEATDSAEVVMEKLANAINAAGTVWSAGVDGNGALTLAQTDVSNKDTNKTLSTAAGIASTIKTGKATATTTTTQPTDTQKNAKPLTLQIGDTADTFNQLTVKIGDIHASTLGIDKTSISIATQDAAAKAIDKIKNAINTVSGIRGDLGATQNRLEHTANNLSVMSENITDAESSIRDTDIAEEMMAYTKNNILIQSAQAMLAQANQVPQGVLQLLQ